jgi:hypothetical protein
MVSSLTFALTLKEVNGNSGKCGTTERGPQHTSPVTTQKKDAVAVASLTRRVHNFFIFFWILNKNYPFLFLTYSPLF